MCYILYAGSDHQLPVEGTPDCAALGLQEADWPIHAPRLMILAIESRQMAVRAHFHEDSVIRVGSYEGCGCGFNLLSDVVPVSADSVEAIVCRESRQALAEYIARNQIRSLYGCWGGDEALPSVGEMTMTIADLADAATPLPERIHLRILPI